MAEESSQNKTLPATPRKIQKAREDGQVARSRDLGHAAVVAGTLLALVVAAPLLTVALGDLMAAGLRLSPAVTTEAPRLGEHLAAMAGLALRVALPVCLLALLLAVAGALLSGGWNFSFKPLAPKLTKLDPFAGVKRMFSKDQLSQTLKASVLALVLGALGTGYLWSRLDQMQLVLALPLPTALAQTGWLIAQGVGLMLLALVAFAIVDVPLQRHLLRERLKMTHQEVRREMKETDGNPEVKLQRRIRMRQMSRTRMLTAVAGADLVVMNPTHYAVALKYDERAMAAPRVVAKGTELMALKIRDLAREHRVPVLQAPPLARALWAHCEIEQEVPAALFAAVAQVLAHVYRLRDQLGRGRVGDFDERELPPLAVPPELDPHTRAAAAGGAP